MTALLISTFLLVVLDVILTYLGVKFEYAVEGNPLLKYLLHNHPEIAIIQIIIITGVLTYKLWQHRNTTKYIYPFVIGLLVTKVAVNVNHLRWIIEMLKWKNG